jgi:4-amino-4-deoxy-L-arabinose transferase-like glycosyltransferase
MSPHGRRAVLAVAIPLAAGAALRVWNALHYPVFMGYDAKGNWEYIQMLMEDWTLPDPEAAWSTVHPPFFYGLGAAVGRLQSQPDADSVGLAVSLLSAAIGLAAVAATAALVLRLSGGNILRAALATLLLVFLPVHISMSAMLSEELLTSALASFTLVGLVWEMARPEAERRSSLRVALLGAVAGLALLTKLSALMLVGAGGLALLAEAQRRGYAPALRSAIVFGVSASLVGGWFYLRNVFLHGYLYPHGVSTHSIMFEMPPGSRGISDYFYFPSATFSAAQAADARMLHSVWGVTYQSIWFDPHRHFLPRWTPGLDLAARILLVAALLPTGAFLVGLFRGARRALLARSAPDRVLVALVVATLAGYVAFTFRNPWFVTVKGSFLLGLATPFAVYSSEVLDGWMRAGRVRALALGGALAVLFAASLVTFTYQGVFEKWEPPGPVWRSIRP